MKFKKPDFWDKKKPNIIAKLLSPFSLFLILINKIKYKKYKIKNIKTICVGNIYIGGTGKTPTCLLVNSILKKFKYKSTFIKKFYHDQIDEQELLKKNGNLICKTNRLDAINTAKLSRFKFAICDDGLQDKKIDYDLKIVCFNSDTFIGNGFLLPAGPLRETLDNLINYDVAIINGNGEKIFKLKNYLKKFNKNLKIFQGKYVLEKPSKKIKHKKFIAFSGIGNHETFLKTLKKNNINIIKNYKFPDHYEYKNIQIKSIKKEAKKYNCGIITTEKDFLRLNNIHNRNIVFFKTTIEINKKSQFENLIKNI